MIRKLYIKHILKNNDNINFKLEPASYFLDCCLFDYVYEPYLSDELCWLVRRETQE